MLNSDASNLLYICEDRRLIGDRIKAAREAEGLSAAELARRCRVSRSAVTQWEDGTTKDIKHANLIRISKAIGVPVERLIDGDAYPLIAETKRQVIRENVALQYMVPLSAWDDETPVDDDEVARPCFTEVEASAGAGKTVVQENHGPKIRFSRRTLSKCGVIEDNAYGIKVSGNSMTPVLPHGATIGVDVGKKTIIDGEMYAVDHDGMLRVKMLYRAPGNQVRLSSFNREEYKDETVNMSEVKIIGRVFWYSVLR